MRPPAIEKMGYYPTSLPVSRVVASYIAPATDTEKTYRLLDPCAGKGLAAALLGEKLHLETWGVELSPFRFDEAVKNLDRVQNAAWPSGVVMSPEAVSLLFLNPPYEYNHDTHKRLEYEFLASATPKLALNGILVYIVPRKILGLPDVARYLAGHYRQMTVGLYEESKFNQVVVLAVKQPYEKPDKAHVQAIQALATADLPILEAEGQPLYTLPPVPERAAFKRLALSDAELVQGSLQHGIHQSTAWKDLMNPANGAAKAFRPVMPLKKGHVAMLMASGLLGTMRLQDDESRPMLIKGRVVKRQKEIKKNLNAEGRVLSTTYRDSYSTTIAVINHRGEIEIVEDTKRLGEFMEAHGEQIAQHVMDTYQPGYTLDPTPAENAALDTLGRQRDPLPGQKAAGLLPTQRHAAAAIARAMKTRKSINVQGEMGVGKTTIGAAVLALRDSFPAIVLCPPHLVPKWIREIQEVIPGSYAREIRRIGQNSGDPADINDVQEFLDDYRAGRIPRKSVAVISSTSSKMGAGWEPAYVLKQVRGLTPDGRLTTRKAVTCPQCGQEIVKIMATGEKRLVSPKDLGKRRIFCENEVSGWKLDKTGRRVKNSSGNPIWETRKCRTPLFAYGGKARRWAIAEYILKHARNEFKMLIADEVHEYKAKSSDRGIAFHQLVVSVERVLTLTGTFFGGKSTTIFWLLHRLNAGVRRDFAFDDEKRWAKRYGVMEETRTHKDSEDTDGSFTGNRRYRNRATERPGISPEIVNRLLGNTIFLGLKDLGLALPGYTEEIVQIDMEDWQGREYVSMDNTLKRMARRNFRYMSTWLQWSLARPNSSFRDEVVTVPIGEGEEPDDESEAGGPDRKIVMKLPVVFTGDALAPKEKWLIGFCQQEREQNRRVLIYVRQTGTRDIQTRIAEVLKSAGLRVKVLRGNVPPRKREAWIEKHVHTMDVLITNPRLVQTGLDLVDFASVVFFEIEYSLYTLWQALRRVWRLGQKKPVKAVFAVYKDSMEAQALALMGEKMQAAQLMFGDEVSGAIVPEMSDDFMTELARRALAGVKLDDLQTLFAEQGTASHSPLGSMTRPSAPIVKTWDDWAAEKGVVVPPRRRRKTTVPQGQLPLAL